MQRAVALDSKCTIAITLKVNPHRPEITAGLLPGQTPYDNVELTDTVFRIKLAALIARLPSIFQVQVR